MSKNLKTLYINSQAIDEADQSKPFIFCLHYAGGNAGAFNNWVKNSKVNYITVELPGHGRRISEELTTSLDSVCKNLANEIAEIIETKSLKSFEFSLYGHSMGAIMAFCTAKILINKYKILPKCIQISGRHAPMDEDPSPYRTNQGVDALVEELRDIGHTPEELLEVKEFRDFFIPMIYSDYKLAEDYIYDGTILDIPIFAYCGKDDSGADVSVMKRWEHVTSEKFSFKSYDGDHFFIFDLNKPFDNIIANDLLELCMPKHINGDADRLNQLTNANDFYERGET